MSSHRRARRGSPRWYGAATATPTTSQAVVDPEYRGDHVFTDLERAAAEWAARTGIFGLYSEATAVHPYSQKANVALGAVETGVLVGYIPASVEYAAIDAEAHRRSLVLYSLKTNAGHDRPVYAPPCDREMIDAVIANAGLRGSLADPPPGATLPATGEVHHEHREDHNHLVVTALTVGDDFLGRSRVRVRRHLPEPPPRLRRRALPAPRRRPARRGIDRD